MIFFPADVLSEDAIIKWYSDGKGRSVLLEQLKPFVEWLKQAEEGERIPALIWALFMINVDIAQAQTFAVDQPFVFETTSCYSDGFKHLESVRVTISLIETWSLCSSELY
jgi:eIF4-gamma/eIF5/eIF2-epsilon